MVFKGNQMQVDIPAGSIFHFEFAEQSLGSMPRYRVVGGNFSLWYLLVEDNPAWFEEIKDPEKPKRMAPAYFLNSNNEWDITGTLFYNAENAKIAVGIRFISWPALPDSEGYYPGPKKVEE